MRNTAIGSLRTINRLQQTSSSRSLPVRQSKHNDFKTSKRRDLWKAVKILRGEKMNEEEEGDQ